jgi:hypothetical protein
LKFTIHTLETAPEASKRDLRAAQKAIGFIPNLFGVPAEAPIALIMMLAGSSSNECGY